MKLLKFFRRGDNQVMGRDEMAALLKAAPQGELFYEDVAYDIYDNLATPELITPTLFALTRATGMLLKALDKAGYPVKEQYEAMLDVWLNDVDGVADPFDDMTKRFLEFKRICH